MRLRMGAVGARPTEVPRSRASPRALCCRHRRGRLRSALRRAVQKSKSSLAWYSGCGAAEFRCCAQSKPSQCTTSDAVDVLLLFLRRVGVVEAQVADAAIIARQAEVQADRLSVADVQVAVGLGREAGADAGRVMRRGGVMCRIAGRSGQRRLGKVPAVRSCSMIWRRKLLGLDAPSAGAAGYGARNSCLDFRADGFKIAGFL